MTKQTVLKKIKETDEIKGLIADEHKKDDEYINGMLFSAEDMRHILDDMGTDLWLECLQAVDSSDRWNELRRSNVIVDQDAPYELTVEEWAEYFSKHI